MHRHPSAALLLLFLAGGFLTGGCSQTVDPGPRTLRLQEDYVSPEGWHGARLVQNGQSLQEELDSRGADGRIDLWRFYRNGARIRALHDLDGDDLIEVQARYHPRTGALVMLERYQNDDRRPDLRLFYTGRYAWRQEEDRNGDGRIDRLFSFTGPHTIVTEYGAEATTLTDAREIVPVLRWKRVLEDTNFDGELDTVLYSAAQRAAGTEQEPPAAAPFSEADRPEGEIPPAHDSEKASGPSVRLIPEDRPVPRRGPHPLTDPERPVTLVPTGAKGSEASGGEDERIQTERGD